MSSSDDDWMPKSKPAAPSGGAAPADVDMLAARRQALRQMREAQERRQQQQQPRKQSHGSPSSASSMTGVGERGSRQPPAAGRLGASSTTPSLAPAKDERESSLPAAFLGSDSEDNTNNTNDGGGGGAQPPRVKAAATAAGPSASHRTSPSPSAADPAAMSPRADREVDPVRLNEQTLEELRERVEAKKKLLAAARERERALQERWRAEKAQKLAEVHQLDTRLRDLWGEVEDAKSAAETQLRTAQDDHEREMRLARQRVEQELKATYEPQLAELQARLGEKRAEEAQLRKLLQSKGESEDLVQTAIAAALSGIVSRLGERFAADQRQQDEEWAAQLRELVRHEVRSSFAVAAGSEAQTERKELAKGFTDALDFWRSAEEEIRRHVLAMDDALLTDMESTLREDMGRLQREQLAMEEVYIQSREAWAAEHQRLLQAEFDASLRRREAELEHVRGLRHQLHVDRLRDLEEAHAQRMASEQELHAQEMAQLRELLTREEQLHAERQRIALAAQQDVATSTDSLRHIAASCESVIAALRAYQAAVEEGRAALEADRRRAQDEEASLLGELQGLVARQATAVEEQQRTVGDALAELAAVQARVERQLEEEAAWLARQVAACEGSRAAWDREHRQWRALVQRERGEVEARFAEALGAVQAATAALAADARDEHGDAVGLERTFGDLAAAVDAERAALHTREGELRERQATLDSSAAALEVRRGEVGERWKELQRERAELAAERETLRREEGRLQQTAETLDALRAQVDAARAQAVSAAEQGRALQRQLTVNRECMAAAAAAAVAAHMGTPPVGQPYRGTSGGAAAARMLPSTGGHPPVAATAAQPVAGETRLAQTVLAELRRQLSGVSRLRELPVGVPAAATFPAPVSSTVGRLLNSGLPTIAEVGARDTPWAEDVPHGRASRGEGHAAHPRAHQMHQSLPRTRHVDPDPRPAGRGTRPEEGAGHPTPPPPPSASRLAGVPSGASTPAEHWTTSTPQLHGGSDWSGVGGQTLTNLLPLSDADSFA